MKLRLSFALLCISTFICLLSAQSRQKEAFDLYRTLRPGMSQTDSLRTLYDVYDLSDQDRKPEIGWEIIGVAERAKDYDVLYEMIPVMSSDQILKKEVQERLMKIAERLPDGINKKAVEAFIQITVTTQEGSYITPEERQKRLLEYLKNDVDMKNDAYQNFLDLYRVVVYMGLSQHGNVYMEYLDRLADKLDRLPQSKVPFESRVYTTAANYYTRHGYPEKAVEMDRKLLKFISRREKENEKEGRKFRSYDRYKYIAYLRMLGNYKALTPKEVDEYYQNCLDLAKGDEEINDHLTKNKQVEAYYLMAKGKYAEAIPVIEEAISRIKSRSIKYSLIGMLKEAAEQTHNHDILVESLSDYVEMLEARLAANSEGAMQELQIRYDVRKLEEERNRAEQERREVELASDNKFISIALIALFVLAIALMLLGRKHFRLIHVRRTLQENNEKLKAEVEELLYTGEIPGTEDLHLHTHEPKNDAK